MSDDRDKDSIQTFWRSIERILMTYSRFSAVRLLHFKDHEGLYLAISSLVLIGLIALASWSVVPNWLSFLIALPAVYYVIDAVLANTVITFISQQPIHPLRSILLTLLNILNVGLSFAVFYASLRNAFTDSLSFIKSIYFSFATLATLGYGDIKPDGSSAWSGQLVVVLELITGFFILACVLNVVISWAHRGSLRNNNNENESSEDKIQKNYSETENYKVVSTVFVLLGMCFIFILPLLLGPSNYFFDTPFSGFRNLFRLPWCFGWSCIGFAAMSFRKDIKFSAGSISFLTYTTIFALIILVIASSIFSILHMLEKTRIWLFYFFAAPMSFLVSYLIFGVICNQYKLINNKNEHMEPVQLIKFIGAALEAIIDGVEQAQENSGALVNPPPKDNNPRENDETDWVFFGKELAPVQSVKFDVAVTALREAKTLDSVNVGVLAGSTQLSKEHFSKAQEATISRIQFDIRIALRPGKKTTKSEQEG